MPQQPPATAAIWREFAPVKLDPILENALDAFHKNGFHGTTVRDLARRIGVTVPAIYYHYENKEALLVALLDSQINDLISRCRAAIADGGDDPVLRFTNFFEAVILNMTYRARQSDLDSEVRHLSAENHRTYAASRKKLENMALDLVTSGVASGDFSVDDIPETVRSLLGMAQSIARWFQIDGPLPPSVIADRYTAIALRIVGYRLDSSAASIS